MNKLRRILKRWGVLPRLRADEPPPLDEQSLEDALVYLKTQTGDRGAKLTIKPTRVDTIKPPDSG